MSSKKKHRTGGSQYFYDITIDLHGYTLEDAVLELEKVLYSGKHNTILVIHGVGSGILKNGLRDYLRSNSFIKRFYKGEEMNLPGGDGVTLVDV